MCFKDHRKQHDEMKIECQLFCSLYMYICVVNFLLENFHMSMSNTRKRIYGLADSEFVGIL